MRGIFIRMWSLIGGNWKGLAAGASLPIALFSLLISFGSWQNSTKAVAISDAAHKDARAVAGLDQRPVIQVLASLNWGALSPAQFSLFNAGRVEAQQIIVDLIEYRIHIKPGSPSATGLNTAYRSQLPSLAPNEERQFILPKHWKNGFIDMGLHEPPESNVLGIRVSYVRPADKQVFVEECFYFRTADGRWLSENNQALKPDVYDPIRAEVLRRAKVSFPMGSFPHDPSHSLLEK